MLVNRWRTLRQLTRRVQILASPSPSFTSAAATVSRSPTILARPSSTSFFRSSISCRPRLTTSATWAGGTVMGDRGIELRQVGVLKRLRYRSLIAVYGIVPRSPRLDGHRC